VNAAARRPWHRRWRHSLGARLTLLFVLFALVMSAVFMAGMQAALRYGWQDYARPLVSDYIDRLAAQIGTPPDVDKARALTERLPLRIRIDGPSFTGHRIRTKSTATAATTGRPSCAAVLGGRAA